MPLMPRGARTVLRSPCFSPENGGERERDPLAPEFFEKATSAPAVGYEIYMKQVETDWLITCRYVCYVMTL